MNLNHEHKKIEHEISWSIIIIELNQPARDRDSF